MISNIFFFKSTESLRHLENRLRTTYELPERVIKEALFEIQNFTWFIRDSCLDSSEIIGDPYENESVIFRTPGNGEHWYLFRLFSNQEIDTNAKYLLFQYLHDILIGLGKRDESLVQYDSADYGKSTAFEVMSWGVSKEIERLSEHIRRTEQKDFFSERYSIALFNSELENWKDDYKGTLSYAKGVIQEMKEDEGLKEYAPEIIDQFQDLLEDIVIQHQRSVASSEVEKMILSSVITSDSEADNNSIHTRIILLDQLGIVKSLQDENVEFKNNRSALSRFLSIILQEKEVSVQPAVNAMLNNTKSNKNPYCTEKSVKKAKTILQGFHIMFNERESED